MTLTVDLILLIIAAILFALAAFGVGFRNVSFIAAGLFCWVLTQIL